MTFSDLLYRRASVLRELNTDAVRKRELAAVLDVSRSTIDRALRELTAHDLVERVDRRYRTTLAGRLALQAFEQWRAQAEGIEAALGVLSVLPRDAPITPAFFAGASVVTPTPLTPHSPAERNAELLGWADHVRGLISAVSEQYVDNYRAAVEDGTAIELAFPTPTLQRLITTYDIAGDPVLDHDHVEIRETSETLPCSVKIHSNDGERIASLTVYGPDGLRGLVTNDSQAAVSWASSFIDRHWHTADGLPSP